MGEVREYVKMAMPMPSQGPTGAILEYNDYLHFLGLEELRLTG